MDDNGNVTHLMLSQGGVEKKAVRTSDQVPGLNPVIRSPHQNGMGNNKINAPRKQETPVSVTENYGLTDKTAIKTGGGPKGQRAYLDKLRGPKGEKVKYKRIGSCCAFETPNAPWGGMLDKYELTYEGLSEPVIVYLNMYDLPEGKLFPPAGFIMMN
jgi:hypothetical protein